MDDRWFRLGDHGRYPAKTMPDLNSFTAFTEAGEAFRVRLNNWLQDTRLLSEAAYRLYCDHKSSGEIKFSDHAWPKRHFTFQFVVDEATLSKRVDGILKRVWSGQFVFLETLWEEYLQQLVVELRHIDASIFEPFCDKEHMALLLRRVLNNEISDIEDLKLAAAQRFATVSYTHLTLPTTPYV